MNYPVYLWILFLYQIDSIKLNFGIGVNITKKKKQHIGIILLVTTICLMVIKTFLAKEMALTRLDYTYLYMLTFLCVKSIVQEGRD